MAHTAALYTVRVKRRYGDHQPLGDIDGNGTYLLDVFMKYLDDFEQQGADVEKIVRCLARETDGDEIFATMQHGASGVAADIVSESGQQRLRQVFTDSQLVRCGLLLILPRNQTDGWMAAHVNNARGIKGLLEVGMTIRFRDEFPDLILEMRPYVPTTALRTAIENDQLNKVKLVRYERPADRATSSNKWVRGGVDGKLELDISMRGRGQKLRADLVRRFFEGNTAALQEIFEFEGIRFETAKVEVEIDGRTRTFNLEQPASGHPMTVDLEDIDLDADGEPSAESLETALREAIGSVAE